MWQNHLIDVVPRVFSVFVVLAVTCSHVTMWPHAGRARLMWCVILFPVQEELNAQISSLLHSFQDVDGRKCLWDLNLWTSGQLRPHDVLFPAEFLYLDSFLQTFKREWMGIDRLRMDKFFQVSVLIIMIIFTCQKVFSSRSEEETKPDNLIFLVLKHEFQSLDTTNI